jgi:hypothetical protein
MLRAGFDVRARPGLTLVAWEFKSPLGHKISPGFVQVTGSGRCRIRARRGPLIPL